MTTVECFPGLSREEQATNLFEAFAGMQTVAPIPPPLLVSATIGSNGTTFSLVFNEIVQFGAGGNTGWTIAPSGGAATLAYTSGAGTTTLVYTISRTIGSAETATVSYVQPGNGVENVGGTDLASIVAGAVTNNAVFSPTNIAGLRLWLKADALVLANNDPVTSWTDSSGLGNNATQATVAKKPTFKTAIVNGLPVVRFDGTDDRVSTVALLSRTYFMVVSHADINAGNFSAFRRLFTVFSASMYGDPGTSNYQVQGGAAADCRVNGVVTLSAAPIASPKIVSFVATAQSNSAVDLGAHTSDIQFLLGDMAEFIAYDGVPSAGDQTSVRTYLGTKYGIATV